jgi:hypothetical protein
MRLAASDSYQVDLRVLAFNDGVIASYRTCGFVEEGREPDSCWLDGQCYDDIIMGFWPPSSPVRTDAATARRWPPGVAGWLDACPKWIRGC